MRRLRRKVRCSRTCLYVFLRRLFCLFRFSPLAFLFLPRISAAKCVNVPVKNLPQEKGQRLACQKGVWVIGSTLSWG